MKKIIIILAVLVVLGGAGYKFIGNKTAGSILSPEEAKAKATEFINNNLVQAGTAVEIKGITEEQGLYKITVNVGGKDYDSYLTKDGGKFFPQVLDMNAQPAVAGDDDAAAATDTTPAVVTKSDKPKVELFVMSECPYGTQIEKGILPVVEALGDKIDFTLKFCDYAMHGEKELKEQMNQYCIQKEQADKFKSYLTCYLEAGDSASCVTKTKVDAAKRDACVSATDKEFKITEKFNDKTTWSNGQFPVFDIYKTENQTYGVQGSPTLVINGAQATSGRDSASLLKTICGAFNTEPSECSKSLSSTAPAAGFGTGADANGSNSGAACATN